jgi:hypothetical protein
MSEEQTEEISQKADFDIEALQANLEGVLSEDLEDEVIADDDLVTEPINDEIVEPEFDIDAAINSGEHVNLTEKITPEQAEEAAKARGWNPDGQDKFGHKVSPIEFLERASFFRKNDLLKGDIDKLDTKLNQVLEQNKQIAQKSIEDKRRMAEEFRVEKEKLLSGDFLDEEQIKRVRELDSGIAENTVNEVDTVVDNEQIVKDYSEAKEKFTTDNDWYGKNRAMTALADKVGTEYATDYEAKNGILPSPKDLFEYVLEEVNKDFPEPEKVKRVNKVSSSNRTVVTQKKTAKKTFADLPEDERAIAREVIEATGQTEEAYLSTYKF